MAEWYRASASGSVDLGFDSESDFSMVGVSVTSHRDDVSLSEVTVIIMP